MSNKNIVREAVGIFDSGDKLQAAIDELGISGFDRYEMSVIGSEKAMKEKFHVKYKNPKLLMDDPETPRGVNISTEEIGVGEGAVLGGGMLVGVISALIAVGGVTVPNTVPAAIVGATAGVALGGVMAKLIGDSHAERLQKQIDNGGLVLWVVTSNQTKEKRACDILRAHGAKDVHLHSISLTS